MTYAFDDAFARPDEFPAAHPWEPSAAGTNGWSVQNGALVAQTPDAVSRVGSGSTFGRFTASFDPRGDFGTAGVVLAETDDGVSHVRIVLTSGGQLLVIRRGPGGESAALTATAAHDGQPFMITGEVTSDGNLTGLTVTGAFGTIPGPPSISLASWLTGTRWGVLGQTGMAVTRFGVDPYTAQAAPDPSAPVKVASGFSVPVPVEMQTVGATWWSPEPPPPPVSVSADIPAPVRVAVEVIATGSAPARTSLGAWTVDESQALTLPFQMEVQSRTIAPVEPPPAGTFDPVTNTRTPGTGAVTPLPARATRLIVRNSPWMPDPVLDLATGWNDKALFKADPARSVFEAAGRIRVVISGRDVTYYRGAHTKVTSLRREEPFGSILATVDFDSITPMEPSPEWLRPGAPVDIDLVEPDGTLFSLFEGHVAARSNRMTPTGAGITATVSGALFQPDLIMNEPPLWDEPKDAGALIWECLRIPGSRYINIPPTTTGILATDGGSKDESRLERVRSILSTLWTDDGSNQWTLKEQPGRRYTLATKDRTTVHWTVVVGTPGISVDLSQDATQAPNVYKGSGVDADNRYYSWLKTPNYQPGRGEHRYPFNNEARVITVGTTDGDTDTGNGVTLWQKEMRNNGYNVKVTGRYTSRDAAACWAMQATAGIQEDGAVGGQTWSTTFATGKNGGDLTGAYHAPVVADPRVEQFLYTASGAIKGPNPLYDPSILRVETWVHMPDGTSKAEAERSIRARFERDRNPGWHGTITMTLDAREAARIKAREGTNVLVRGWEGQNLLVHVSQVNLDLSASPYVATLDVDTHARDAMELAAITKRDRDAKTLAKRPSTGPRNRSENAAGKPLIDSEMVGWVTDVALFPGLWCPVYVPLGKIGTLSKIELTSDRPVEFYAALFGSDVKPALLARHVPDPSKNALLPDGAEVNPYNAPGVEDALNAAWWIESWGGPGQPCGYERPGKGSPATETSPAVPGGAFTGVLNEGLSIGFDVIAPPFAKLLLWSPTACTISGRLHISPEV
jgi:hypothetical protein